MNLLSQVIKKILNQNQALKQGVQDAQILEAWAPAVGELIAKHAVAAQVKNKTLIVNVDHPIWKQELHSNKAMVLQKLNAKISELLTGEKTSETSNSTNSIWINDLYLGSLNQSKTKSKFPPPKLK